MKISLEEMEWNWILSIKLLANPLYVVTIQKPKWIQSPYFKTPKEAEEWLMENYKAKPFKPVSPVPPPPIPE